MKTINQQVVPAVESSSIQSRCGFDKPFVPARSSLAKPLAEWIMEDDDAPIFKYLYQQLQPKRHLEFGTWRGTGTCYCLENSPHATVWTINLLDGETAADGRWAYDAYLNESESGTGLVTRVARNGKTVVRADARGAIGAEYLDKGLGHRVCQIYADSLEWDDSNYPDGFFDSVLIDGGHAPSIVINDTKKAIRLVKAGGVVLWHDYCPDPSVQGVCSSTAGVTEAINNLKPILDRTFDDLFWINPSWILLGTRNDREYR